MNNAGLNKSFVLFSHITSSKIKYIPRKSTKKIIKNTKSFTKIGSIFGDLKIGGQKVIKKQLEYDWSLGKFNRFIKDEEELEKVK